MTKHINPLRINVGFLVNAEAGFSRTFEFDVEDLTVPPDLEVKDLRGTAQFSHTPQGLLADVVISGRIPSECSRCLDSTEVATATSFTELYAFDERSVTESELILPKDHQINLTPLIRENLILDMPMSPLCKNNCLGLCPVCGINRNHESCEHKQSPIDPRFSSLKDLLDLED